MYLLIELVKGQLSFGFEEDEHPREGAGQHEGTYKPGEFVPKGQSGEAEPKKERRAFDPKGKTDNPNRIVHQSEEFVNEDVHALLEDVGLRKFVSAGATEEDFEFHAKHSLQALRDLAEALGLAEGDISFNGKLGMGIGDLGQKTLAQYDGRTQIITVAKARATGSLCHEWFHAFDNLSTEQLGASELKPQSWSSNYKKFPSTVTGQAFGNLVKVLLRSSHLNHGARVADAVTQLKLDDGTPYWSYLPEVTARAFEAYVCDKLEAVGKSNDYLVDSGRVNRGEGWKGLPIYPEGKDRATINAAFDALWKAVAADKHLMKLLSSKPMLLLELEKARKATVQPGQLGMTFDEAEHPRHPAGDPHGGEFVKKDEGQMDAEEPGGALAGGNSTSGRSETADTGPVYHDTFTGPRYTYGGQNRPLGYAAIPKGFVSGSNREHPSFRHGVIDYPRELTPEETYGFELERVYSDSESGGMSPEQVATAGAWIEDFTKDLPNMEQGDKDMLVGVYRAHKKGPAALRSFLDETRATNYYSDALATQLNLPQAAPSAPVAAPEPAPAPVWALNEAQYLAQHHPGVYRPWLAEISPMQVGMMSDRQRKKYQAGQQEKHAAYGQAKGTWEAAIMEAYDRGEVTTGSPGLSQEAGSLIHHALVAREQATAKANMQDMRHSNSITVADQVNVGDRVYDRVRRVYGTVLKKVRGRLSIASERGEPFTGMFSQFDWMSYDDLDAAAKANATQKSLVIHLTPEEMEKAMRRPTVPSGQQGFSFDEAAHPRVAAGQHEGNLHGGEFTKKPAGAARTDVHRPAEMVPGDYDYVTSSFAVPTMAGNVTRWDNTKEWADLGHPKDGTAAHSQAGRCDHCGAHHKYQVILKHKGTGELVSVGHQCYENRFTVPGWQNLVADKARRAELKEKRAENVERGRAGMTEEERAAHDWATGDNAHRIAADMARRMAEFGPLTDKAKGFMVKLHKEHLEGQKPKPEEQKGEPVPAGKQTVRGVVLGVKVVDSDFGSTTKMLVQDERGFKVWGTRPGSIGDAEKGALVEFTGTLEPSKDDEHFGFFSRPTKARFTDKPEVTGPDAKEIQRIVEAATKEYPGGEWSGATVRAALKDNEGDVRQVIYTLLNHWGMGKEARRDYPDLAPNALAKAVDSDPVLLLKARPQPGQLGLGFNEEQHPREPAGTERGGEFTKKPMLTLKPDKPAKEGKMGYAETVEANLKHMGTERKEWSAVGITGFAETTGPTGQPISMPEFSFPVGYTSAPSMFAGQENCCELCGTSIKNYFWIQNDEKKWTLGVGSECVKKFSPDDKSGADLAKEAKWVENRAFADQALALKSKLYDLYTVRVHEGYGRFKRTFMHNGGPAATCFYELKKLTEGVIIHHPSYPPDNATVTRWANKNGARVRELMLEASRMVEAKENATKPAHEPLGGHMASHVPIGTKTPMTEPTVSTEEFRLSKGGRLLLAIEPTIAGT